MKLYNILKEIILEQISENFIQPPLFKTWISGRSQIMDQIKRLFNYNKDNYIGYYVEIKYIKKGRITNRWGVLTHIGKSLRNNDIVRIYEQNNDAGTPIRSKTYLIDKIKGLKISKVSIYQIPDGWEDFNPNGDKKMKNVSDIAPFGSYQYALSTIKARERQLKKKEAELAAKGETPQQKQLRQKEIQQQTQQKRLQQTQPNNDEVEPNNNELNKDELNNI